MYSSVAENRTGLCWGWRQCPSPALPSWAEPKPREVFWHMLRAVFKIWSATDTPDLALFKCYSPELMASREEMNMLEVSAL